MKKLKLERKKLGLSYTQMAKKIGISQTYYWQIENKKRRLYYNVALKIAKVFNLKPDDLFFEEYD